ncbi:MAG: phosphoribosyltransferase [Bacteroidota bacterium]|nr:phosphoribosyltransferase [Bacteroidota bacterium]MDP4193823.1 phosphoribosyltransferase [Bacteroidota bacterium]
MYFIDRKDAGEKLAELLMDYSNREDVLILALPRGGVPVAYEVSQLIHAPLDVFLVRKLGVPGREELAFGAIASGGLKIFNDNVIRIFNISDDMIKTVLKLETEELNRREKFYRNNRPFPNLTGKKIILVDDGMATGATMKAAVRALKGKGKMKVIVSVPVAPEETCHSIAVIADEVVCAISSRDFSGVGSYYEDFSQVSDEEVIDILQRNENYQY